MLYKEPKSIEAVTERAVTRLYFGGQAADLFFSEIIHHLDKRMTIFFVDHFQRRY